LSTDWIVLTAMANRETLYHTTNGRIAQRYNTVIRCSSELEPGEMDDQRYILISADCHGGGAIADYRPYLVSRYHDDFDAWAATYEITFDDLKGELGERNWDSARRQRDMEADGVVAEVIYPNTIPPFYPKSSLTFQPPAQNTADVARRWA